MSRLPEALAGSSLFGTFDRQTCTCKILDASAASIMADAVLSVQCAGSYHGKIFLGDNDTVGLLRQKVIEACESKERTTSGVKLISAGRNLGVRHGGVPLSSPSAAAAHAGLLRRTRLNRCEIDRLSFPPRAGRQQDAERMRRLLHVAHSGAAAVCCRGAAARSRECTREAGGGCHSRAPAAHQTSETCSRQHGGTWRAAPAA